MAIVCVCALGVSQVLTACLAPNQVACGDRMCPADRVCTPGGCALPEAAAACVDMPERAACTTAQIPLGQCLQGACRDVICGDGFVDAGEACDDGNVVHADGCSARCDSNETCGNGIVDALVGEQCDDGNTVGGDACNAQCRIPTCGDGIVDRQNGEACDDGPANALTPNAACRPNCQPQRCGDAILDATETCDDGNLVSGDGCAPDCKSNEQCGNGIVDVVLGEECDSGPRGLSGDGCSSRCRRESDTWINLSPQRFARNDHAAVFDSNRQTLVVFGGTPAYGAALDDTLQLSSNSTNWDLRRFAPSPEARIAHAMAYDSARQRIVLFGGGQYDTAVDQMTRQNDTWEFDGISWSQRTFAVAPSARYGHTMVFDSARNKVVLFGGFDAATRNDVWEYDGTSWQERSIAGPLPPPRVRHAAAFDSGRNVMVIYGGYNNALPTDTWEYNGNSWRQITGGTLGGRWGLVMAYAPQWQRVLAFGGFGAPSPEEAAIVHAFDGVTWTTVAMPNGPTARAYATLTYQASRNSLALFGGQQVHDYASVGDVWEIVVGGAGEMAWQQRTDATAPPKRSYAAMSAMPTDGSIVLFGGLRYGSIIEVPVYYDDTWVWQRGHWRQVVTGPSPSAGTEPAMAYDAKRQRVVLFGGNVGAGGASNQTWEFDGTAWQQRATATVPNARAGHTLTWDPVREVVVMFGGQRGDALLNDTWQYDGSNWRQLVTNVAPPARHHHAMAFDPQRGVHVLFGGQHATAAFGDTWELNGTSWTMRATATAPSARRDHALAWDPAVGKLVLFGGAPFRGSRLDDVWWYDGTWVRRSQITQPAGRVGHAMTFLPTAQGLLLFGGNTDAQGADHDVWVYQLHDGATPVETCDAATDADGDGLRGCADPDCSGWCFPTCTYAATASCGTTPYCGDSSCHAALELGVCTSDCP